MISEGSRDTEDWSNDAEDLHIENLFKTVLFQITVFFFLYLWLSKCSLGENKRLL